MIFSKRFVFGGIIGAIVTMLASILWDARAQRDEEDNENRGEEPITFGVQESTNPAQEHDERFCYESECIHTHILFSSRKRKAENHSRERMKSVTEHANSRTCACPFLKVKN